ncbi:MAG: PHP domain-containing protein [Christensenellaceae bacterium]
MIAVDLHIHSALSPCADDDMTPNNITGMAALKGLDMIAVTDHNSCGQLRSVIRAAENYGVAVLPGMEATTREDVHVLCYFSHIEAMEAFGGRVEASLPKIRNKPAFFGNQLFYNEVDEVTGQREHLLLVSSGFSLEQLSDMAWNMGGIAVPAHINKGANSLLPVLGMIPRGLQAPAVEVFGDENLGSLIFNRKVLRSSDAHQLGAILEPVFHLPLPEPDPEAVIAWLRS